MIVLEFLLTLILYSLINNKNLLYLVLKDQKNDISKKKESMNKFCNKRRNQDEFDLLS